MYFVCVIEYKFRNMSVTFGNEIKFVYNLGFNNRMEENRKVNPSDWKVIAAEVGAPETAKRPKYYILSQGFGLLACLALFTRGVTSCTTVF